MSNPHFEAAAEHRPQLVTEDRANEDYLAQEGVTDATMQFSALNRIAEATLAVAYEQHTANQIALLRYVHTPQAVADIHARLGLGDTK